MAADATNERIVTLLGDVLRELKEAKARQERIAKALENLTVKGR